MLHEDNTALFRDTAWTVFTEVTMRLAFLRNTKIKNRLNLAPAEYEALFVLYVAENGSLRMGTLADSLCFSPSRLSYVITGLIERGLVEKSISKRDGRGYVATITAAGRKLWEEANQMERDLFNEYFFNVLSKGDQERFAAMLAPFKTELPTLREVHHRY
ncbi:MarR family transcriptional regulator [Gleimia sp. 6138-11-ORH1]|uniref:MarR family winged helix-turn-helix transcriptional regulator n=1 Tax=Gleimia sp. 6138-11-ORH1 TaxID=2973937 RepID=UPI0021681CDE|nr:MarR family transcriptional regulator [Gleimia sp. 6138-11-ORH1]MCS4484277.1 MarR family transcriptional regulator [Gleimia sp. 6138-11-ORH1]